jgi:hypothetical protein
MIKRELQLTLHNDMIVIDHIDVKLYGNPITICVQIKDDKICISQTGLGLGEK